MRETQRTGGIKLRIADYTGAPALLQKGITLIEVLVVTAVISLLAAMLLPSLRQAREQAKGVVCQTNLRAIAEGWHTYLQEHGGYFLKGVNADINYGGKQGSSRSFCKSKPLNTYLKYPTVSQGPADAYRCPSDRGCDTIPMPFFDRYGTSYRMNLFLVGQDKMAIRANDPCKEVIRAMNPRLRTLKKDRISSDSRLVLVGDFDWWNSLDFNFPPGVAWHGGRCRHNVAFLDGHTSFLQIRKGIHVTSEYTTIPFQNLENAAAVSQKEVTE